MSQQVLIPYETVKAYYASQGIALYNGDSSGQSDSLFHVTWNDKGFTGISWDTGNESSPAYNWTKEEIQAAIDGPGNLDKMFDEWDVSIEDKLVWMLKYEGTGCIID